MYENKKKIGGGGGAGVGGSGWGGVRVDVNGEVKLLWGRLGSKVWGRWVMWGMGDVNQE